MTLLRDIPALITLADELHFGRAADKLGTSQPQLSAIIKRIESRCGFKVFERRPAVIPTQPGLALIESARRTVAEADQGLARARAVAKGTAGPVRFGFAPIALLTPLGLALERFVRANPAIELKLVEQHSASLTDGLCSRSLDLAVSRQPLTASGTKSVEIHREPMILALSLSHPLAAKPLISVTDVADHPLVHWSREAAPEYFDELERAFRQSGVEPRVAQTINGWSSLLALAAAGLGVGIVSASVGRIAFPGIVYRQIDGFSACASFWLSWNPASISPAAGRLCAFIERDLRQAA